jgi:phage N-6-adenine-methyltransferase
MSFIVLTTKKGIFMSKMATRKSAQKRPRGRPRMHPNGSNAERCRTYRKRLKRSVHFRSDSHLWETPQALFDKLDAEFHFTVDVCALPDNAKCPRYYTPDQDGLQQDWSGEICWCNPPYGRVMGQWMQKAYDASKAGALVVCLIPARSDTRWWHDYVIPYASEIRPVKGRIKFVGARHSAPFPSAVVIFKSVD